MVFTSLALLVVLLPQLGVAESSASHGDYSGSLGGLSYGGASSYEALDAVSSGTYNLADAYGAANFGDTHDYSGGDFGFGSGNSAGAQAFGAPSSSFGSGSSLVGVGTSYKLGGGGGGGAATAGSANSYKLGGSAYSSAGNSFDIGYSSLGGANHGLGATYPGSSQTSGSNGAASYTGSQKSTDFGSQGSSYGSATSTSNFNLGSGSLGAASYSHDDSGASYGLGSGANGGAHSSFRGGAHGSSSIGNVGLGSTSSSSLGHGSSVIGSASVGSGLSSNVGSSYSVAGGGSHHGSSSSFTPLNLASHDGYNVAGDSYTGQVSSSYSLTPSSSKGHGGPSNSFPLGAIKGVTASSDIYKGYANGVSSLSGSNTYNLADSPKPSHHAYAPANSGGSGLISFSKPEVSYHLDSGNTKSYSGDKVAAGVESGLYHLTEANKGSKVRFGDGPISATYGGGITKGHGTYAPSYSDGASYSLGGGGVTKGNGASFSGLPVGGPSFSSGSPNRYKSGPPPSYSGPTKVSAFKPIPPFKPISSSFGKGPIGPPGGFIKGHHGGGGFPGKGPSPHPHGPPYRVRGPAHGGFSKGPAYSNGPGGPYAPKRIPAYRH